MSLTCLNGSKYHYDTEYDVRHTITGTAFTWSGYFAASLNVLSTETNINPVKINEEVIYMRVLEITSINLTISRLLHKTTQGPLSRELFHWQMSNRQESVSVWHPTIGVALCTSKELRVWLGPAVYADILQAGEFRCFFLSVFEVYCLPNSMRLLRFCFTWL